MRSRRSIQIAKGVVNVKPLVTFAASVMPPGRLRLEMVKLAHELDPSDGSRAPVEALSTPLVGGVSATDG